MLFDRLMLLLCCKYRPNAIIFGQFLPSLSRFSIFRQIGWPTVIQFALSALLTYNRAVFHRPRAYAGDINNAATDLEFSWRLWALIGLTNARAKADRDDHMIPTPMGQILAKTDNSSWKSITAIDIGRPNSSTCREAHLSAIVIARLPTRIVKYDRKPAPDKNR